MRLLGDTIVVQRGEVFELTRQIVTPDGAPFVLSKDVTNPYILLNVASNTFALDGRYQKQYWLDLALYHKFTITTPTYITPEQFALGLPVGMSASYTVFYTQPLLGPKEYWRWSIQSNSFVPYVFEFTKKFIYNDTSQWKEQIYQYEIRLVGGNSTLQYLRNLYINLYPDTLVPSSIEGLIEAICKKQPISYTGPLSTFTYNELLLKPSKLIVNANL